MSKETQPNPYDHSEDVDYAIEMVNLSDSLSRIRVIAATEADRYEARGADYSDRIPLYPNVHDTQFSILGADQADISVISFYRDHPYACKINIALKSESGFSYSPYEPNHSTYRIFIGTEFPPTAVNDLALTRTWHRYLGERYDDVAQLKTIELKAEDYEYWRSFRNALDCIDQNDEDNGAFRMLNIEEIRLLNSALRDEVLPRAQDDLERKIRKFGR